MGLRGFRAWNVICDLLCADYSKIIWRRHIILPLNRNFLRKPIFPESSLCLTAIEISIKV
jgi:hypothetical protein